MDAYVCTHTELFREHNLFKLRSWNSVPIVKLEFCSNREAADIQELPHPPKSSNNRLEDWRFSGTAPPNKLEQQQTRRHLAHTNLGKVLGQTLHRRHDPQHTASESTRKKHTAVVLAGDGERIFAAHDMGDLTASPSRSGCWAVGGAGGCVQAVTLSHVGSGKTLPAQTPHSHELVAKRMMHKKSGNPLSLFKSLLRFIARTCSVPHHLTKPASDTTKSIGAGECPAKLQCPAS